MDAVRRAERITFLAAVTTRAEHEAKITFGCRHWLWTRLHETAETLLALEPPNPTVTGEED